MISKLSSHLGPASIFSGGVSAPSLILYLDAGSPLSYPPMGFTVSGGGTQHILNNWPFQPSEWNNYGPSYLQGGDFQDLVIPSAGWYIVDDDGHIFQVLSNSVWFTGGNPTPYYNGQGWFFVLDGTFNISASNSTVTFYETLPTVTTIYGGSTWYDLTNLNNDISLSNTTYNPTYSNLTKFEGSFQFNGTSSFGSLISGTAIPVMDSHYTIESWYQANSYDPGEDGAIIGWGNYGSTDETNALRQYNGGFLNYWWYHDLFGTSTFSSNYWYHVACTYDGYMRKMYINGQLIANDTPGVSHSVPYFNNLTVGFANGTEYFDGNLGMIKVWNKSLNDTQVLNSFNSNKSKYGYDYGSMTFSSSNSSYLISTSTDYVFGYNDFTIEAFVKITYHSGYDGIVSLSPQSDQVGPRINISNTGNFEFWTSGSGGPYIGYTVSNDKWYHLAMSRNSGTVSCFVNGKLENQFYDSTNFTNQDLVVGRYYTDTNAHYIDGYISNVRVINGTGIYTSDFSVPTVQLSSTVSNVQFLITSQELAPTRDILIHTVTSSNIGWTSSLPANVGDEFNYTNFVSTDGLALVNINSITSNMIYMVIAASSSTPANVYYDQLLQFNKNFSFEWVFECSGGGNPGADGFCVQWTTSKSLGEQGGNVGKFADSSTINAFLFQTYFNNQIYWFHNNVSQSSQGVSPFNMRQNVYYWMDYVQATSTMYISYATTNSKPISPQHTFNGVTFDGGNYYIGVGAATGGSVDNHILKSMRLTF